MDKEIKKDRNSNVEVLRLIAMFMIVICHWGGHGAAQIKVSNEYLFNKCYLQFCGMFGQIANCIFILITGYFQIDSDFNKKRFSGLLFDIEFYSVILFVLTVVTGKSSFSLYGLASAILPFIYTAYWFIVPYLAIYILSPYLNILFDNLKPKQLGLLIGFLLLVNNILPMVGATTISSNLCLFIMYYFIGAVIKRKTYGFIDVTQKHSGKILGGTMCVSALLVFALDLFGTVDEVTLKLVKLMIGRFSIITTIVAVLMFLMALNRKPCSNKVINRIAQSTLAVYLISENENVYHWLYIEWFNNESSFASIKFVPESIIVAIIIMVVCLGVDVLRCYCVNVLANYSRNRKNKK